MGRPLAQAGKHGRQLVKAALSAVPRTARPTIVSRLVEGESQWLRSVLTPDARRTFDSLVPSSLAVVEVSGETWKDLPWASHTGLSFPGFDLCEPPQEIPGPFDLVICEQVLEHVVDPLAAVSTLRRLCKPDGHVFVSTPFLVRLHDYPGDYWRFTPDGLDRLLRCQGLEPVWVRSWGNRRVIVASFDRWATRLPWQTLRNEPQLPAVVWSLARPRRPDSALEDIALRQRRC